VLHEIVFHRFAKPCLAIDRLDQRLRSLRLAEVFRCGVIRKRLGKKVTLAQAARILTGAPGYPDLHPRTRDEQVAATEAWGNYYDQQLRDYCAPAEYLP